MYKQVVNKKQLVITGFFVELVDNLTYPVDVIIGNSSSSYHTEE